MEPTRKKELIALRQALAQPESWLAGPGAEGFAAARLATSRRLKKYEAQRKQDPVVVAALETAAYLAGVLDAVAKQIPLVLANPRWGEVERAQAAMQIKPGLWLGEKEGRWPRRQPQTDFNSASWRGAILIPTGGTGGRVRWAVHRWATLAAAAHALADFLDTNGCTHVSTLPPCHVSGLMPAVRAIETGGQLWLENWKVLEGGTPPQLAPERAIISLVPTQLLRLLKRRAVMDWLRHSRAILLGGAAASPALLWQARKLRLPITLAYGLTETAAVVAAQRPRDFLAGRALRVTPLPHAKIKIGERGRIIIQAKSLFAGYYPALRRHRSFATEDFGTMDTKGRLQVCGRLDRIIVTGGEKVHPAEVEQQICSTGLVKNVRVIGLPDEEWGERVVAIYSGPSRTVSALSAALRQKLSPASIPKVWIRTPDSRLGRNLALKEKL
jgi:O-succinylbenzoic acid--CoA ligase